MRKDLGFGWTSDKTTQPPNGVAADKATFLLKKMLPEYVWDIVCLEGNPYSFLEVQTLLDGTTVAGHSLEDQLQVLNQAAALKALRNHVAAGQAPINKELVQRYHALVAKEEALKWGCFRDGQVGISGTEFKPPNWQDLDSIFQAGLQQILAVAQPFERALAYFFFGSLNQFFFDGNKRTSRLNMNTILMTNGYYYLSIPGQRKAEFDEIMVAFYDSRDATAGMRFMASCYRDFDGKG